MILLLLEALLALLLLVGIVWWTMFSGRQRGELPPADDPVAPGPGSDNGPPETGAPPPHGPAAPRDDRQP